MQIKTSPEHRKCKYENCNNILSVYNHEDYCNVHLKAIYWEDKVNGIPINRTESDSSKVIDVLELSR